jgi:hypothetical protein
LGTSWTPAGYHFAERRVSALAATMSGEAMLRILNFWFYVETGTKIFVETGTRIYGESGSTDRVFGGLDSGKV